MPDSTAQTGYRKACLDDFYNVDLQALASGSQDMNLRPPGSQRERNGSVERDPAP
jgi:hypothetical protein